MVKIEAAEARDPLLGCLQGLAPDIFAEASDYKVLGINEVTPRPAFSPLHMLFLLPGKPVSSFLSGS